MASKQDYELDRPVRRADVNQPFALDTSWNQAIEPYLGRYGIGENTAHH